MKCLSCKVKRICKACSYTLKNGYVIFKSCCDCVLPCEMSKKIGNE